jgi:hypothetical protein
VALTEQRQRMTAELDIPATCAAVTLRVEAGAGEGSRTTDIYFANVEISPIAGRSDAQPSK